LADAVFWIALRRGNKPRLSRIQTDKANKVFMEICQNKEKLL